ncbi:hypothetical protein CA607_09000 [Caulobacter vibrioides]|nr:hypothetical protein CA607_09000 [Caulobacter vibrioides]
MPKGTERPIAGAANGSTQRSKRTPVAIVVTDNWPEEMPITRQEVMVIETHLRSVLDDLLGPLP